MLCYPVNRVCISNEHINTDLVCYLVIRACVSDELNYKVPILLCYPATRVCTYDEHISIDLICCLVIRTCIYDERINTGLVLLSSDQNMYDVHISLKQRAPLPKCIEFQASQRVNGNTGGFVGKHH